MVKGILGDIGKLGRAGSTWTPETLDQLRDISRKEGALDPSVAQYLVSILHDQRNKFVGKTRSDLEQMLVATWKVDKEQLSDPRVPLPITLHSIDAKTNRRRFYRLEIDGNDLIISSGRLKADLKTENPPRQQRNKHPTLESALREYHQKFRAQLRPDKDGFKYDKVDVPPPPARLTNTSNGHNKFYDLSIEGTDLVIKNGAIGAKPVEHRKSFVTQSGAMREMLRRKAKKIADGYVPQQGTTVLEHRAGKQERPKRERKEASSAPALLPTLAHVAAAAPLAAKPEPPYPVVQNLAEWHALSDEDRETVLDDMQYFQERYPHLSVVAEVDAADVAKLKDPAHKAFIEGMTKKINALDLEVDSDYYARVGRPQLSYEVYALDTGEIIGGYVRIYQDGAMGVDDDASGYYDTREEAKAAGLDTDSDVNWGNSARFDEKLKFVGDEPYVLEWSGH
jgi:predicted DNA-binding WGR domain protein